jgi:LmbE family N-acetylglucosaminyl deacetylase
MAPGTRLLAAALSVLLVALLAPAFPRTVEEPLALDRGGPGLGLALRRLGNTARVLTITAHPDDEHNGVLVRLARGLGARTALLTLTRGEGGQNAIGPELFFELGVLRTAELDAVHRHDGVEQLFGRAYEFGFSFSVEETLSRWGREETLGDVVRAVRAFRPDVVLTLPLEGAGGGQHHQASGRLAREAFRAAADPSRFPDQARVGLRPWQARKIYVGGVGGSAVGGSAAAVRVPTGVFDPLLGETWEQLGSRARAMHRCQGMRQLVAAAGPAEGVYTLLDAEPPVTGAEGDILDGIDPSVAGLARLAPGARELAGELAVLQARLEAARQAFSATEPARAVAPLAAAVRDLRAFDSRLAALVDDPVAREELRDRLADEARDAEAALRLAHGLVVEAGADDGLVTPGESFVATVSVAGAGGPEATVEDVALEVPAGWTAERQGERSAAGAAAPLVVRYAVRVAPGAPPTQPYWRRAPGRDRHELRAPEHEGLPWSPPDVVARVHARLGGVPVTARAPVVWRYEGSLAGGEKRHPVQVVPALSVRLAPELVPVPLAGSPRPIELRAFVRSLAREAGAATLRLEAPEGWRVEPVGAPLRFVYEGEEVAVRFTLHPPRGLRPGPLAVRAVAARDGRESREAVHAIEYPHVERRQVLRPAETRLVALDVRVAGGGEVGYVMGPGDAVADAIRQLGLPVALLDADDLAFSDLARFGTIVTGIRAYETRPDLRAAHGRLMRWVEAGGHLVVQYNRPAWNRVAPAAPVEAGTTSPYAPYPALVTNERVSDETTPVRVLLPDHPLLTRPNRIAPSDWDGWVQERGIALLDARDDRYAEILGATDPFPYNPGEKRGLLVEARVKRGTWTYVGLVLFRQVPAGVPGAWRLLANLVSRGQVSR